MSRFHLGLDAVLADPMEALRRARNAGWLADSDDGAAVVLTHERVREMAADGRLHSNIVEFLRRMGVTSGPFYDWMAISPLNRDGAEHQRYRAIMSRTFTPRSVERLRPFLERAAHELIDAFAGRGSCEFMAEFADAYPSLGLCELIGVPLEDRERFRGWANTIGLGFSPVALAERIADVDAALTHLLTYTGELAAHRRRHPEDDLVSRLSRAAEEDGWSDFEVRGFIAGLVFAGHETTKNQLGWMVSSLAERPDVWDAVWRQELTTSTVVEEVLRYRSAVTTIGRTVTEPVEHGGERFEPGTRLFLSLWSADHDEATYPRPDDIAPEPNRTEPHLAFGHGAHHCLGAALARSELREALAALTTRLECPVVAEGAAWKPPVGINGPERLPLRFTGRHSRADRLGSS